MAKKKGMSRSTEVILIILLAVVAFFGALSFLTFFNIFDIDGNKGVSTNQQVGNLVGIYSGVTPCADCSGIDTTLTLVTNPNVYTLRLSYQGKDTNFTESGTWSIKHTPDGKGQMYVLVPSNPNAQPTMYQILSNTQIRQLDGDGKELPANLPFTLTLESN